MTPDSPALLERLILENELGWMIGPYEPREQAIKDLLDRLEALTVESHGRFGDDLAFDLEALMDEGGRNPHKVRAFLQALRITGNAEMLLMVWRILQGLSINEVSMNYRAEQTFSLRVVLAGQDAPEAYITPDIRDAALLRHFGIMKVNELPLFDGFFPLRTK